MTENWHQNLKSRNRGELISAAKELCMKQSFLNVNIKEVCGLAGVSRVTFYKHFQSMDELVLEVQMELLENMTEAVQSAADTAGSGRDKLLAMLKAWTEYARLHPEYIKFILLFDLHYEAYRTKPELSERYDAFVSGNKEHHFLTGVIEAGVADGSLKTELEAPGTARFIFTAMMGMLQKFSLTPLAPEEPVIQERFVQMLLEHLSAGGAE
ncbi:TetR/AcrR family transcriptional regulator ['Paenibacillus yunnanensis' Narsing Rao et al. 2020]|uniref:TetR/AcrR family transcriptional regulator n=1 Tax=Paenibacillus tengchongensis TaxID=2608684 RepID=UPI00124D6329|nr:TetR/AcrR family transcriptional regulator [Paenibacillus tengchongensis]